MTNFLGRFAILFTLSMVTHVALAQNPSIVPGFDYRADLTYDDQGHLKPEDGDSSKTTIDLKVARLIASGKVNKEVDYKIRYNLVSSKLEYGYVNWACGGLYLLAGHTKIYQGGFRNMRSAVDIVSDSEYLKKNKPFNSYDAVIETGWKSPIGMLGVQLTDDPIVGESRDLHPMHNRKHKQPAVIAAFVGNFGAFSPLLEYGSYDINNSFYATIGVKVETGGLMVALDHTADNRNRLSDSSVDTLRSQSLDIEYTIAGLAMPFAQMTRFDRSGKSNVYPSDPKEPRYNDHNLDWSIGARILAVGPAMKPYLAYRSISGEFDKKDSFIETETRTQQQLIVGVTGELK